MPRGGGSQFQKIYAEKKTVKSKNLICKKSKFSIKQREAAKKSSFFSGPITKRGGG